ncbi:MAG: hypothetical protein ACODAG_12305, partial [Myxococcota bacterium]
LALVESVFQRSVQTAPDGLLKVTVRASRDLREDASRAVVQAGAGLRSLRRVSSRLESIFVELSERDDEGASP